MRSEIIKRLISHFSFLTSSLICGSTKIVLKLDKLTKPKAAPFGLLTCFFGV